MFRIQAKLMYGKILYRVTERFEFNWNVNLFHF